MIQNCITVEKVIEVLELNSVQYKYEGDTKDCIMGISSIIDYQSDTLTWIKSIHKYRTLKEYIKDKKFRFLVVDEETKKYVEYENAFICKNPREIFYIIANIFVKDNKVGERIGKNTYIDKSAMISETAQIGENCYIGKDVVIGDYTKIYHNVVIASNTYIGENCLIKSNTVIGEEGHCFIKQESKYYRVPHLGSVRIGNNVEIGSGTCIDRGNLDETYIGEGTKIDSLCYIAHNVKIENNVFVTTGNKIMGGVWIGENSYLAPGSVIRNQIHIGKESMIGMGSVVVKNVEGGYVYMGNPARKVRQYNGESY